VNDVDELMRGGAVKDEIDEGWESGQFLTWCCVEDGRKRRSAKLKIRAKREKLQLRHVIQMVF